MNLLFLYYGLNFYWILGIGLYSLRFFNNFFHRMLQYGRFSPIIENQAKSSERRENLFQKIISILLKPFISEKFHWRCIYSVGLFLNTLSLIYLFIYYFDSKNENGEIVNINSGIIGSMIIILLYEIHLVKRCIEVFSFQPWTHPARLVGSFLFLSGVSYYICAPLSLFISSLELCNQPKYKDNYIIHMTMTIVGIVLFLWSWYVCIGVNGILCLQFSISY